MYTGILVRGNSHANFVTDPLVSREIAISPSALGIAIDRGSGVETFWLNYAALSKIGKILNANGSLQVGFKTSDLPITFDASQGNPDLYVGTTSFTLKGLYTLPFSLNKIKSISNTSMSFTDNATPETLTTLTLANLAFLSTPGPVLGVATTTSVGVTTNLPGYAYIVEAANGTVLGSGVNSGTVTYSVTQTTGSRVFAYYVDSHKNRSFRTSILIP